IGRLRDIHLQRNDFRAELLALRSDSAGRVEALVGYGELRALLGEQHAGGSANSRSATGDDANFVLEAHDDPQLLTSQSLFLVQARMCRATPTSSPRWFSAFISL